MLVVMIKKGYSFWWGFHSPFPILVGFSIPHFGGVFIPLTDSHRWPLDDASAHDSMLVLAQMHQ